MQMNFNLGYVYTVPAEYLSGQILGRPSVDAAFVSSRIFARLSDLS